MLLRKRVRRDNFTEIAPVSRAHEVPVNYASFPMPQQHIVSRWRYRDRLGARKSSHRA
jgi:hypothetical protein